MANNIEKATIFQKALENGFPKTSLTAWMDKNTEHAEYRGGAEIKIPSITMQGLGDYKRDGTGAPMGDVTLTYQTVTMTQDRGRGFFLDAMDVNESNFVAKMGAVMGEFQNVHVVPEVDAYRLSKLFKLAGERKRTYTPVEKTIVAEIRKDVMKIKGKIGMSVPLVVHMSVSAYALIEDSDKFDKWLDKNKVKLIVTPDDLMKTEYDFFNGRDGGQEKGGFDIKADAKQINWLIVGASVPISPCKQDKVRNFSPDEYQAADGWYAEYRRYYDLWVADRKLDGIFANVGA